MRPSCHGYRFLASTARRPAHRSLDFPVARLYDGPHSKGFLLGTRRASPVAQHVLFIELADWLTACDIDTVAMESTGVYWIPLYEILEARGFTVLLVKVSTRDASLSTST